VIEAGAGAAAGFSDAAYEAAGVEVVKTAAALWKAADIVAKVRPPTEAEAKRLTKGQTLISFFYPAQNEALMELASPRAPMSSRWTWCRASPARRRWTRCRPWPISPATAP
jgi:NAD/NADP transhydrogenase alpha subunit